MSFDTHFSLEEDSTHFLAGRTVPAGTYRIVGTNRTIHLAHEDVLPATFDGHSALYERCPATWAEIRRGAFVKGRAQNSAAPIMGNQMQSGFSTLVSAITTECGPSETNERILHSTAESARLRKP